MRVCAEEVKEALVKIHAKIRLCAREYPEDFKEGGAIYWDNAKWHSPKVAEEVFGGSRAPKVEVLYGPALSPDMNKPAEQMVGVVQAAGNEWCKNNNKDADWAEIRSKVHKLFYKQSVQRVRQSIDTLPKLYELVAKDKEQGGTEGDYAPRSVSRCDYKHPKLSSFSCV